MNLDRAQGSIAVILSVLMHAGFAMLGGIEFGKAHSISSTLAVSVVGYKNSSTVRSTPDAPSKNNQISSNNSKLAAKSKPLVEPALQKSKVANKAKKKPIRQLVKKTANPVKKKPTESIANAQQPSAPPTSVTEKAEVSSSQSTRASKEESDNQATASNEVNATLKPEISAFPLYHLIPKPPYPSRSRDLGEIGTVMVTILVAIDGSVADAYVSTSSGYALLDGSALSTVKSKWLFRPASKGGKSVASWIRVPINFKIN